ncbi:hypothetical protein [Corynebacterium sp.]|uniref:hypothetical protein n=1 Tax=Corynebacterium sp. TaxID=1720 RepID=UPI0026DC37D4|nr:hypothetical protein [Corynebacterium sp.]MDO5077858.1 hypothetical protein [Corynebacterium sp.]
MAAEKPESILLASHLWLWVVGLEIVHQVLSAVQVALAPELLVRQMREYAADSQMPLTQDTISVLVYASVASVAVFAIAIMGVVLWMALVLSRGGSFAAFARRALLFFGVYLGVRLITVFVPPETTAHVAWVIVDGCVQIGVSVLAILAVYLITRKESLHWTGESHG